MAYHAASPYLRLRHDTKIGHHRHSLGVSAPRHVNTDACIRFAIGLIVLAASYLISHPPLLCIGILSHLAFFVFEKSLQIFFCLQTATRLSDGDAFLLWSRLLADLFWLQIGHNTSGQQGTRSFGTDSRYARARR